MRIYKIGVTVDVGDELSDKQVEGWVQDALGPAARAISARLEGKVSSKDGCGDVLFSDQPQRITLTEGDVLIFRCDKKMSDSHVESMTDRLRETFDDKFKILILDGGVDMVVGEMVEKEGAGG